MAAPSLDNASHGQQWVNMISDVAKLVAESFDYALLAENLDYVEIASHVDEETVAGNVDLDSIAIEVASDDDFIEIVGSSIADRRRSELFGYVYRMLDKEWLAGEVAKRCGDVIEAHVDRCVGLIEEDVIWKLQEARQRVWWRRLMWWSK